MKRLDYLDALRGWAIFTVILGHSIQQLNDSFYFLNNRVFSSIYSFHMPLFFFLSGLLFKHSLKQKYIPFISKKLKQLILPCVVWAIIFYLFGLLTHWFQAGKTDFNLSKMIESISPSSWRFWFLVELFKSYILLFLLYKIVKNQVLVFLLATTIVLFAPAEGMQRFLLPFFLIGIFTMDNVQFLEKRLKILLPLFFSVFIALLFFWKGIYTIYFSKFPALYNLFTQKFSLENYDIALLRFLIGFFSCYFWFLTFKYIFDKQILGIPMAWLKKIGKETLGIYILQASILEMFLTDYIDFSFCNNRITSFLILPVISFIIIQVIMFVISIINRNRTIRLLLIGKE